MCCVFSLSPLPLLPSPLLHNKTIQSVFEHRAEFQFQLIFMQPSAAITEQSSLSLAAYVHLMRTGNGNGTTVATGAAPGGHGKCATRKKMSVLEAMRRKAPPALPP